MTVIFYAKGDHAAGFVGYRAATTLGNSEYKQSYFSSEEKAVAKNKEWRDIAEQTKKASRLQTKKAENYIAVNFRAVIHRRSERLLSGLTYYVYPAFIVGTSGKNRVNAKIFAIGNKHTFDEAFLLAVNAYCTMYGLGDAEKQELLSRKPEKKLFTGYLYTNSVANGYEVDLVDLCERLNMQKEGLSK